MKEKRKVRGTYEIKARKSERKLDKGRENKKMREK